MGNFKSKKHISLALGILGAVLVSFAVLNFHFRIEPFAEWYIPIIWYGYIFVMDSIVFRISERSLITSKTREFVFMLLLSVPFWLIFEAYNLFTASWFYQNYTWYIHLVDFTTIMPAVLETFSLVRAIRPFARFDRHIKRRNRLRPAHGFQVFFALCIVVGALSAAMPVLYPKYGFPFIWFGLFLLIDPINYLIGAESLVARVARGEKSFVLQLFASGLIMGFFWEMWNYFAYPKWLYSIPLPIASIKLFEMPIVGYLGYLPFAAETFLFYALFSSFVFGSDNPIIGIWRRR
jgi:hypothetical protein